MCTLVLLCRPGHRWPVLIATNRDERLDRPWMGPGRHWPRQPDVVAGLDRLACGSWLGMNDAGVVAGVLNRIGSLGPSEGTRSRGELVLQALRYGAAREAAGALAGLSSALYRPFNLVIVDHQAACWLRNAGDDGPGEIELFELPSGLSMFSAHDRNDPDSPRQCKYLPLFQSAAVPEPDSEDWSAWMELLACREFPPGFGPEEAMTIRTDHGFGTLSSSLIALPGDRSRLPVWRFADRRGDGLRFKTVDLKKS